MTTPQQLYATLEPVQQLNGTLQQTGPAGPAGPPGPPGPPGADGEHGLPTVIADEGVELAEFSILNFIGSGVTAAVDIPNNRINVTIPGGGGHTIQDEGTPLTQRTGLNFVGAGVTATDDSGNNRTVVTIPGGGSQTPWTSNIDAAGFALNNAGVITSELKGHRFGVASGVSTNVAQAGANILLYAGTANNWAGMGADGSGNMWFRTGLEATGAVSPTLLITPGPAFRVGIGNPSPAYTLDVGGDCNVAGLLNLDTAAGVTSGAYIKTGGLTRWSLVKTGAETGSNAGANFEIQRYTDAGSALGVPVVSLLRSSGQLSFNYFTVFASSIQVASTCVFLGAVTIGNSARQASITVTQDGPTNSGALLFGTTSAGTQAERMRISAIGNLGIGVSPNAAYKLDVAGDVNITGVYRVNGVAQGQTPWTQNVSAAGFALSGAGSIEIAASSPHLDFYDFAGASNLRWWRHLVAGGNFRLDRVNDAGTSLGVPFQIAHATGLVTLANALAVTGDVNITGVYRVNGVIGIGVLPSTAPAAGSKGLWYDPADGNRVKFVV